MIQDVAGSSPVGRPIFLFIVSTTVQPVVEKVETNLGYRFRDSSLLRAALTHPSFAAENKLELSDNQRLEFLGDAVLELALTEVLYVRFPEEREGVLTKWRARLVSKPALAEFALQLELGPALLIGKGEDANSGRERASNLADCLEAVLGAVYLDGGFEEAKAVIIRFVSEALQEVTQSLETGNPKGELQEVLQAIASESPNYSIVSAKGPDHAKTFVASVVWRSELLGKGEGASKKLAEAAAAANALSLAKWVKLD